MQVTPGDPVVGRKQVEYLLLPERAGVTTLEPFRLPFFDPTEKAYRLAETAPILLEVVAESGTPAGAPPGAAAGTATV